MKEADQLIADALRDIAAEAGPPRPVADAAWRAGRRRRLATLAVSAASIAGAVALMLTVVVPPSTAHGPASPPPPASPTRLVSITLSPARPASPHVLAIAADLLRERFAFVRLPATQARVLGRDVVLTGPAADQAQLKTLAMAGVLNVRQVLLFQPYAGALPGASAATYGDASLVNHKTLALFHRLVCTPANSTWKDQVGYTPAGDYDNPDAQIVSCDANGGKYALDVAKVPGTQISSAIATLSTASNRWQVTLTLKNKGAAALATLTADQVNRYLSGAQEGNMDDWWLDTIAFVLDGNITGASEITSPILGGVVQVEGSFTEVQAEDLVAQLKSGALPVDFRVTATRTSGPSASSQAAA